MLSKNINPKEYVIKTFKTCNGKRITEVLKHYYKHVNYYKNDAYKTALEIFKDTP